jgi:hypothetical protein
MLRFFIRSTWQQSVSTGQAGAEGHFAFTLEVLDLTDESW